MSAHHVEDRDHSPRQHGEANPGTALRGPQGKRDASMLPHGGTVVSKTTRPGSIPGERAVAVRLRAHEYRRHGANPATRREGRGSQSARRAGKKVQACSSKCRAPSTAGDACCDACQATTTPLPRAMGFFVQGRALVYRTRTQCAHPGRAVT